MAADQGACINPMRHFHEGTTTSPFFVPCATAAYTFAKDDLATPYGQCQSDLIACSIGKKYMPNPRRNSFEVFQRRRVGGTGVGLRSFRLSSKKTYDQYQPGGAASYDRLFPREYLGTGLYNALLRTIL